MPTTEVIKGMQPTTGTVHFAVRVKHLYTGVPVLKPACTSLSGRRAGARHYLSNVTDTDRAVTCKKCLAS